MKGEKTGGREKGTPNKITAQLREMISDFLTENFETVQQDFKELKPFERAKVYSDLLQYGLPKLQSVSLEIEPEGTISKPIYIDCNGNLDQRMREEMMKTLDLSNLSVEELKNLVTLMEKVEIDKEKIIQVSIVKPDSEGE